MSSYRNYVPWKSTLPTSSSYKSGSSSSYSSRENANNTETATSPRFSSISSPAAYRPSYSGGTYRSVPIKKENVSTYPSRYNSTTTTDAKDEKERDKSTEPSSTKSQTTQKKYQGNLSNKENTCSHKPSRLSTSISNLSNKSGQRSRDPSPIQYERRPSISTTSRVRSRDPSPVLNNVRGRISREASPVQSSRSSLIASRVRSREPSPATSYTTLRGRSRDPSPSSLSGYTPGTYRLASRISNAYTPRYGSNTSLSRTSIPDKALSYMSSSDLRARTVNRQSERREKKAQEEEATKKKEAKEFEKSQNENKRNVDNEPEVLVSVSVVTRATSPTPPGSAVATISVARTRRAEIAKTIEKIIQRSSKKPQHADKEIQSDRLDDSTKYLRYSTSARTSIPWTSPVESKYSRYGSSSSCSKTTRDSLLRSEIDSSEKLSKKEDDSSRTLSRSDKSKSSSDIKNKSLPTKQIQSNTKQKSPESPSMASPRNLPPTVPKAESPTKSSSSPGINKWPNKDFRKSALNVGPTDRPRKSRTPSTGTDTEDKTATFTPPSQIPQRIERSASACSEESDDSTSTGSSSSSESDEKDEQTTKIKTSPAKIQSRISNHESSLASNNSSSYNKNGTSANTILESSGMQDQQQARLKQRHNTSKTSSSPESPATKSDGAKSSLFRTLGCVSNFFTSKSQDPNGEEIYLETSSDKSNSIPNDLVQDATSIAAVSQSKQATTATINSKTDNISADSNLWFKNNQQVDTDSALDLKNDMKYKLRHIDSGEAAWWMKNDDEDAAEDVLKTHLHNNNDENTSKSEQNSWWGKNSEKSSRSKSDDEQNQNETEAYDWWLGESENKSAVSPSKASQKSHSVSNSKSPEIHKNASSKSIAQQNSRRSGDRENDVNQNNNTENAYKLKTNPSGDRLWWMGPAKKLFNLRPIESGERAWWLQDDPIDKAKDDQDHPSESSEGDEDEELNKINENVQNQGTTERVPPLGDRASPEGVEDPSKARKSPYDNTPSLKPESEVGQKCFISRHTNIDELLGGSCRPLSPLLDRFSGKNMFMEEITPAQVRIHDSTAQMPFILRMDRDDWDFTSKNGESLQEQSQNKLDDAALQVYKDGDYGAYLDLESSLAEQAEEIEGLNSSRKNSIVVRTQLSVRVHSIIEKLLSSEGSELRRALFSLKQIFQEDKDLVHGFVALGGLNCLVRVGNGADQNYQNYILRALGQVMLYVDGMNGVMKHGPTIQWLYSLIASKYRLVVKTALKLLLVFVEYVESNCYLLVNAVHTVDKAQGSLPWSNIMKLLKDYENADTELLIYATSLINKTLAGLSDQDSFYDESDLLEQQGMEGVIQRYMSRPGTDLDLLDQLQLYEAVLKFEDGESDGIRLPDNSIRKTLRFRSSTDSKERRKSRRHSTGTSPSIGQEQTPKRCTPTHGPLDEDSSSSNNSNSGGIFRECKARKDGSTITPGLRRRRERAERQKTFMKEQEAAANGLHSPLEPKDELNGLESENEDKRLLLQLKRDHTVKDLTQKLSNIPTSPQEEKPQSRIGDMTGLISKAKEGLAKSKSKGDISRSPSVDQEIKKSEPKKSENELHWEELIKNMSRPLTLCDLDFNDLNSDDEKDVMAPRGLGGAVPPPPPPIGMPPPMNRMGPPPPGGYPPPNLPPPPTNLVPPPVFNANSKTNCSEGEANNNSIKKNKKTVKLFWKEVREDLIPLTVGKTIWDELPKSNIDTQKLEHLFESRAKDLMTKEKQQEMNKNKEIIVLDHKRSNAINIAMTKLPPPRAIKAAILKMDATVVTREGIDKLLNMLPTEEERGKIQEAQMSNPELPLGSAEQFLLTLSSISELAARLKLWAFKLDFENSEREIAEPLMDLKQGVELLKANKTFKCILSTLLSIGIFLNGAPVKGFQIEYLAKVPEVKDTVHKHSLLHHLCHMVMETSEDTTDLYSEIGPITRASKADFTELAHNLVQLETECKSSWDRLKLIAKHDCPAQLSQKLVDFLADCAERIIILQIVHRRVINRYRKFLLWLGVPQHRVAESRPNEFCRILSEFALEYRTTRERVHQQMEKKANHRERNKTRGKMIIDVGKFKSKEDRADAELKQLLDSPNPSNENPDGTLTWRRRRAENLRSTIMKQSEENFTDGDDEILESLVKTATKAPGNRPTPRERKRTRNADRKSLKRSRTREGFTAEQIAASPEH